MCVIFSVSFGAYLKLDEKFALFCRAHFVCVYVCIYDQSRALFLGEYASIVRL